MASLSGLDGQQDAAGHRFVGPWRHASRFHLRQDHRDHILDMGQGLFARLAAGNGTMIHEGRANGPPLVALPINRHMIADGHPTLSAGSKALMNSRSGSNVPSRLDSEIRAMSLVRPLCPQQPIFEPGCLLSRRFGPLYPQEQTFMAVPPFVCS